MKAKWLYFIPLGLLLVLQAFPTNRSTPKPEPGNELRKQLALPNEVFSLLKNACYDCHSNQTTYPWYTHIQPIGWWIQSHITKGRSELNFSEFGLLETEDQIEILKHSAKMIRSDAMPLSSYLWMHPEAKLDAQKRNLLLQWFSDQLNLLSEEQGKAYHKIYKDTCDDNDANPRCCFNAMPENLSRVLEVAPENEPGERILISGQFFKKDGKTPYRDVLVYVYHTDTTGRYTRKGDETGIQRWHGRLHAWGRTDSEGRYEIRTIQPAGYPGRKDPAHIHAVVWEPGTGKEPYYIPDFLFADDPRLSSREKADGSANPGRSNVITLEKGINGHWSGKRDIILR